MPPSPPTCCPTTRWRTPTPSRRPRSPRGTDMPEEPIELTTEELEEESAEELPDREAMSLINANVAAPINVAAALNVASDNSIAYANAEQNAPITQSN